MREPVTSRELIRRGAHETLAADLGINPAELERPMGDNDKPTTTPYKTDKKGYTQWEIRRVIYPGASPDHFEYRDRHAQGDWMYGTPEGLKGKDLIPLEGGSPPPSADESAEETIELNNTLTLEAATTAAEILKAVALFIQPSCPLDNIPDSETLATWVTNECPSDARAVADNILMTMWKRPAAWLVSGNGRPDSHPRRLIASVEGMVKEGVNFENLSIIELEKVHSKWLRTGKDRPMHPLVPLIMMWQQRPEALKPETKTLRIMPKGLMNATPSAIYIDEPLYDPAFLPMTGYVEEADSSQFALLPTVGTEDDLPPVTPLILASAVGFGALKLGRGARLDKRILIYSLLHMPLDQRRPGGRYEWCPTLEQLIQMLWTKDSWRPNKHAKALEEAFDAVTLAKVRLPDGTTWRPVVARGMPNPNKLSSHAVIQIEVPALSNRGASLNFLDLIADGRISDPAFDMSLALAYLWDDTKARNGGFRVYATRPKALRNDQGHLVNVQNEIILGHQKNPLIQGNKVLWRPGNAPQRDWRHPQAVLSGEERHPHADKVPALHPEARRRLAYGLKEQPNRANRSHERANADKLLRRLESDKRIVIEREGKRWRILEARNKRNDPPAA